MNRDDDVTASGDAPLLAAAGRSRDGEPVAWIDPASLQSLRDYRPKANEAAFFVVHPTERSGAPLDDKRIPLYVYPPLKADFTKMLPGHVLDDTTYGQIEDALDRADAPCQAEDGRWLKVHERIAALSSLRRAASAEEPCSDGATHKGAHPKPSEAGE